MAYDTNKAGHLKYIGHYSRSPAINPQHIVPTIDDNGYILWESRAINTYLVRKYGCPENQHLLPRDVQLYSTMERMLYFDIGTLYEDMVNYYKPQLMFGEAPNKCLAEQVNRSLDLLDIFLCGQHYVAGTEERSLADLSLLATISAMDAYGFNYQVYENVFRWACNLKKELPYYCEVERGVDLAQEWARTKMKKP